MREDSTSRDEAGAADHARFLGAHEHIGGGVGDQDPSPEHTSSGWWCFKCRTKHRHGDPLTDRCPDCGYLLGETL